MFLIVARLVPPMLVSECIRLECSSAGGDMVTQDNDQEHDSHLSSDLACSTHHHIINDARRGTKTTYSFNSFAISQAGLRQDNYPQGFLGFELQVERIHQN